MKEGKTYRVRSRYGRMALDIEIIKVYDSRVCLRRLVDGKKVEMSKTALSMLKMTELAT